MRQISKVVLLVAPVLLVSCGCASKPAWISQKADTKASEEVASSRSERLMQVAKKYEAEGKPEVAYQLYRHIVNQDPQFTEARTRMVAVAPRETEQTEVQLASKPQRKQLLEVERSPARGVNTNQRIAEVDWTEAKKQAALKRGAAEGDEKRVNTIELSYGGPSKSAKVSDVNKIVAAETSDLKNSQTGTQKTVQEESVKIASSTDFSQRIALPRTELQDPVQKEAAPENLVAETSESSMNQEWWDAKQSDEFAKPLPEAAQTLAELTEDAAEFKTLDEVQLTQRASLNAVESLIVKNEGLIENTSVKELCDKDASAELIQVVALLECPEPEVRIAGLIELGIKGSEASATSPAVRALLNDQDAMVRAHAAGTVRDIEGNNSDSVRHLESLLVENDPGVVRLSCYLLGQMGADARPAVAKLKQLRDGQSGLTSLHAAEALTRIVPSESKSYGVLKNALTCDDAECRVFAAVSLGGVYEGAGEIAALALTEALESRDADVRASAALSLGGLGQHAAIAVDQLQEIANSDTPEVRDAALTALACLGK